MKDNKNGCCALIEEEILVVRDSYGDSIEEFPLSTPACVVEAFVSGIDIEVDVKVERHFFDRETGIRLFD